MIEEGVFGFVIVWDVFVVWDIVWKIFDVCGVEFGEEMLCGDVVDDVDDEYFCLCVCVRWRILIVKGVGVWGVTRVGWLFIYKVLNEEKAIIVFFLLRLCC